MRTLSKPMQCGLEMEFPGSGWRSFHFRSGVTTHVILYHYTVNLSFRLQIHELEWLVGNRFIVFIFAFHYMYLFYCVCVHNFFV